MCSALPIASWCYAAGRKVADKDVAASSPEEVTGLITGAIEHVL